MDQNSEKAWNDYIRKVKEARGCTLSFAIECMTCGGGDPEFCNCAKKLWIAEQNMKEGKHIEYPYTCFLCRQGVFRRMMSFSPRENKHVPLCYSCFDEIKYLKGDELKKL